MSAEAASPSRGWTDVARHDLAERRGPTVVLGSVLVLLAVFALGVAAQMADTLAELAAAFPEGMTAFITADAPGGYVVGELFDLIAPLAIVAYAIAGGASSIAGEEARGTMRLLAASPLSRARLLTGKVVAQVVPLVVLTGLLWLSVTTCAVVFDLGLGTRGVAAACLHLLVLAGAFGAVALALSCASGRADVATAGAGGLAVVAYLSDALLPLAGFDRWAELSPWFYYSGGNPLVEGVNVGHLAVLLSITAVALAAAFPALARRDLRG